MTGIVCILRKPKIHFESCDKWDCYCNVFWSEVKGCRHWLERMTDGVKVCRLCGHRVDHHQRRLARLTCKSAASPVAASLGLS